MSFLFRTCCALALLSGCGDHSPLPSSSADADGGVVSSATPDGATSTLVTFPDDGTSSIYALVSGAQATIDMTMYELVDTKLTSLLVTAVGRGVTVRVILDQNLEKSSNTSAYDTLNSGGVDVHWANATYASTHQKTITVDGTTAAVMTLNAVSEDYPTTRDFAILITDRADIAAIEATFAADLTNASITPSNGDNLVWSPTNAQSSLLALINGAKTSLVIENEEMDDTDTTSAIEAAAERGVDVEVVMTVSNASKSVFEALVKKGVKVSTYAAKASLYIHAKVILADYGTSTARAFVGSENFSSTSLTKNRELGLIVSDATILSGLHATLASDYEGATAY